MTFYELLSLNLKINRCYGAKYVTLYCMEKHQGVRIFETYSKTSPKYILNLLKKTSKTKNILDLYRVTVIVGLIGNEHYVIQVCKYINLSTNRLRMGHWIHLDTRNIKISFTTRSYSSAWHISGKCHAQFTKEHHTLYYLASEFWNVTFKGWINNLRLTCMVWILPQEGRNRSELNSISQHKKSFVALAIVRFLIFIYKV